MKRSDFFKAILAVPAAIGMAKVVKAENSPPVAMPEPLRVPETPTAIVPRGNLAVMTSAGCYARTSDATWGPFIIPVEDRWDPGCYGCCSHRGKGACDLCRRRGADPEADRRMDEQTIKAMRGKPGWVEEADGVFLCVDRTDGWIDCRVYAHSFMSPHQKALAKERADRQMESLREHWQKRH